MDQYSFEITIVLDTIFIVTLVFIGSYLFKNVFNPEKK